MFYFPHALILKVTVHYVEAETMSWPHPFLSDFVSLSTVFFSPHHLVSGQKYIIADYERFVKTLQFFGVSRNSQNSD